MSAATRNAAKASRRASDSDTALHRPAPQRLRRPRGPSRTIAAWVPVSPGKLQHLVDQLTQADWLTEAALIHTHLTGQLTERVLPLACPLLA